MEESKSASLSIVDLKSTWDGQMLGDNGVCCRFRTSASPCVIKSCAWRQASFDASSTKHMLTLSYLPKRGFNHTDLCMVLFKVAGTIIVFFLVTTLVIC
jgi:hypothetical protein